MRVKGWRDERADRTKNTKATSRRAMAADFASALFLLNKIRCSISSLNLRERTWYIYYRNRDEPWRAAAKEKFSFFAHQSLINSAKFALAVPANQEERDRSVYPLFLRAEFLSWAKAWRQSFYEIYRTRNRGSALMAEIGSDVICVNCSSGERPRLQRGVFSRGSLERERRGTTVEGERARAHHRRIWI